MLTITLDWLALTFKEMTRESVQFTSVFASAAKIQDSAPRFGYSAATTDGNGVVHMWNNDREEMGHHVIFAGSALRNLFERSDVSQRSLVQAVSDAGGRITRLDIAKDLEGVHCNLENVYSAIKSGENTGTCRTVSKLESGADGITVYMGSRQSEKFARIYNKSAQLGINGREWKRYELECKGLVARALAGLLISNDDWANVFDGIALGMVELPGCKDYEAFFATSSIPIGLPQIEKTTDREKWIQEQVIKAVVVHYHDNPDSNAVRALRKALDFVDTHRGDMPPER